MNFFQKSLGYLNLNEFKFEIKICQKSFKVTKKNKDQSIQSIHIEALFNCLIFETISILFQ